MIFDPFYLTSERTIIQQEKVLRTRNLIMCLKNRKKGKNVCLFKIENAKKCIKNKSYW